MIGVANGRCFGGGIPAFPPADIADGMMDIMLTKKLRRRQIIPVLGKLLKGMHENHPYVQFLKAKEVTFHFDRPTPASADGEVMEKTEFSVAVRPGALNVVVP